MNQREQFILARARRRLAVLGVEVRPSPFSDRDEFLLVDDFNGSRVGDGAMSLAEIARHAGLIIVE